MSFTNREAAAFDLIKRLLPYKKKNTIVAGIPRGAMPMASIIAKELHAELTAILVHKISSPNNPEFAIGCVGISGHVWKNSSTSFVGESEESFLEIAKDQILILKEREKKYGLPKIVFEDRIVIIVDDGIATGATTLCAIHEVKIQNPKKIILAAAVASKSAVNKLKKSVDDIIILETPSDFMSVSQFFYDFPQISDEDVIKFLKSFDPS